MRAEEPDSTLPGYSGYAAECRLIVPKRLPADFFPEIDLLVIPSRRRDR
jgi:hypothetical protein